MGILLGRASTWGVEPPIPAYPGAPMSGYGGGFDVVNNPNLALQTSAAWACINLVANAVCILPLQAFRSDGDLPVKLPNQPKLLTNPTGNMTQSQWLREFVVSQLTRGNTFGLITEIDGYQKPTAIRILNPDSVLVSRDRESGATVYKWARTQAVIPSTSMFHVPGLTFPGDVQGMSPITYGAAQLGLNLSAQKFGKDFLEGDGIPKAVIESEMNVTQAQAQTLKDRFLAATRNREPVVMGAGVHVNQIQIKPEESQFLATMGYTDTQISRFFSVPPAMIGAPEGSTMTYQNREQRALDFLLYAVQPLLKRIEDAISSVMSNATFAKFDTAELLRTDVETQAKVNAIYIAAHTLAPSEVRTDLGRPPMTQAQKEESDLVPLELTPKGEPKAIPGVTEIPNDANPPKPPAQGATK